MPLPCKSLRLSLHGSLLQLRGDAPSHSPLIDPDSGCILAFNGEIFGGLSVPAGSNDAAVLLSSLAACGDARQVAATLNVLQGPWSLVLWHAPSQTLWFGRDPMGAWEV